MKMHKKPAERMSASYFDSEAVLDNTPFEATPSQKVALRVIDDYINLVDDERSNFVEHAYRTADLVHVFAGGHMPSKAVDAVLLHDLGDRATGGDMQKIKFASAAFVDYLTSPEVNEEDSDYVVSLISDMTMIEDTATQYRELDEPRLHLKGDDPDIWSKQTPQIPLDEMFNLSKNVNIESIIIKSCEMLDNLHHPAKTNISVMHDIFEAESFYAPICEVLGYDGLAMELRSYAKQIRWSNLGYEDLLLNTKHFCYEMRRLGPESVFDKYADKQDYSIYRVINQPLFIDKDSEVPYETVDLGEFALDLKGRLLSGNWRIKSVGSLADKIISSKSKVNSEYVPMDVMGTTIISEDQSTVAEDFADMVRHTVNSDGLQPHKALSKDKPFYIQGDKKYIDKVLEQVACQMGEDFAKNQVETKTCVGGYRVSKFTCLGEDNMPIEMQFVTKEDRRAGRVGEWAHIFHKQKSSGVEYSEEELAMYASQLEQIYERKRHMDAEDGEFMINPRSHVRGRRTKQNLYARYGIS
ncbi:hypothetical protein GX865_00650 [Candidatus Saccharibacteria bacterium]|jgi:hypothetical protein|nr:hypothetical protein [Candidatus Saccharibacteria bacterium]